MVFTVILTMKAQAGKRDDLVKILGDPKEGLTKTRGFPGCQACSCFLNDDGVSLHLYEKWDKASDQAAYMKMRAETGFFKVVGPLFDGAPGVVGFEDGQLSKI